jgi:hypothetical protein
MEYYGKAVDVAETIIDAFDSGKLPKAIASKFIVCGGRHIDGWSVTNQILTLLSGYSDAMGFGAKDKRSGWKSVGRQVRLDDGEKAFYILAPCKFIKVDDGDGGKKLVPRAYRAQAVFGIEQTDIVDADLWAKHNVGNELAEKFIADLPLADVAKAWGLTLHAYSGKRAGALGWYRRGEAIALGVENLSTWAHELCHAADYRNGKLVERGQHHRSETVAELGSAILMMIMGYENDADLGGAYKYISSYANAAGIDTIKACTDVIKRTCEAVALILEQAETNKAADVDSDTVAA